MLRAGDRCEDDTTDMARGMLIPHTAARTGDTVDRTYTGRWRMRPGKAPRVDFGRTGVYERGS
jgi:hypothetical protein